MVISIKKISFWNRTSVREISMKILVYIILSLGAIFFLFPFFWMVSTSLKPSTQVLLWPPKWIPEPIMWRNYLDAWQLAPTGLFFKNTFFYVITVTIGSVISCSLVAFGFARLRFRGRNILFFILLGTLMIPQQVVMIPRYILFSYLGWINTYKPLVIPAYFGAPFFIFLLRQFLMTIPRELDDAAKIDGCGWLGIFWRITIPLEKPALGIIAIFSFTWTWNDFMNPLIYLNDIEKLSLIHI